MQMGSVARFCGLGELQQAAPALMVQREERK